MKLIEMRIKDFCDIPKLAIGFFGKSAVIEGGNESGKTTLNNAFLWCLFEKDTAGNKLDPKPKNRATGERILGTEPKVELVLEENGRKINFARTLAENITGKKGSQPIYKGDKGVYEVDGVPVDKKDYDAKIREIVGDEGLFRLITDPHPILAGKDWQKRREFLERFMGEMKIEDELTDSDLEILDGKSVADAVKIAKAALSKADERAGLIPKLIDENADKMVNIEGDADALAKMIEAVAGERIALTQVDPKEKKIAELKKKLAELKREDERAFANKVAELKLTVRSAETSLKQTVTELSYSNNNIELLRGNIVETRERLEKLRTEYQEIKDRTMTEKNCGLCGQELPEFLMTELTEKFNTQKASDLKQNIEKGKSMKANLEKFESDLKKEEEKNAMLTKQRETQNEAFKSVQDKISALAYVPTPEIAKIESEITTESNSTIRNTPDSSKIAELTERENELRKQVATIEQNKVLTDRIKELETELEKLQETITELKRVKELTLNIQRKWNEKIEEKANSLFSLVKWKLFEVQKNEEISDICEAMIDGIGYRETLNTGNKIMACVDLSNTFSKHFNKEYPLFLDNAEAVTKWKIRPVNQHILLKAVEGIEKLKTTFI